MPTGKQIRAARAFAGWDREELAKRVGLSSMTIQNIELDVKRPRLKTIEKIIKAFEEIGIEFKGDRGVEFQDERFRTIEGKDCYLQLMEEVCSQLHPGDEFLASWLDESLSSEGVHNVYKRILKKGVRYRKLIKEGNTFICGPLSWYRMVPAQYFQNAAAVFFQDKSAYVTQDLKKIIIIKDAALAKANKSFFEMVWKSLNEPTETTSPERYE